jgi:hypothetical protein
LEPILAAKILIFADIGKLFVLFFLFARLFTLKNIQINLVFCSLIRIFAADFKGCLRVQAEMIPSNLIRIIPA